MIALRDELDAMLHRIRSERHIRTPVIRCRRCGRVGPAAEPDVTVRAMIFSLGRFGVVPARRDESTRQTLGRVPKTARAGSIRQTGGYRGWSGCLRSSVAQRAFGGAQPYLSGSPT